MNEKKRLLYYILFGFIAVGLLIFFDQYTKELAVEYLAGQADRVLIPGIMNLHYLENRGAAFGMMQNQQTFFIVLTSVFLLLPAFMYVRMPMVKRMLPMHLVCIGVLAGGIGNLIDRVKQNYVVDFFETAFMEFPVFNVADIYVTVSFFVLFLLIFFKYKEEDFDFFSFRKKKEKGK